MLGTQRGEEEVVSWRYRCGLEDNIYKKGAPEGTPLLVWGLLTDTQLFDDSTITLDVFCLQVVEQATTFTYQHGQSALSTEVLVVLLEVLGEVVDTEGEQSDLALCRTSVLSVIAILSKEFCFFFQMSNTL